MDVAVPVRRRRALTLLEVLAVAPQLAEYLVPSLTNGENFQMIVFLGHANSSAVRYYYDCFMVHIGLGFTLRPQR